MKLKNLKPGADEAKNYYPLFNSCTDVENIHVGCGNPVKNPAFSSDPLVFLPN